MFRLAKRLTERWPSGRRRSPAKGVWVKSSSRVRIPPSPPITVINQLLNLKNSIRTTKRIKKILLLIPFSYHQSHLVFSLTEQRPHKRGSF